MEQLQFHNGECMHDELKFLKVVTMTQICREHAPLVRSRDVQTRKAIYETISRSSIQVQESIRTDAKKSLEEGSGRRYNSRKTGEPKAKVDCPQPLVVQENHSKDLVNNDYLKAPNKEVVDNIVVDFINRTGDSALRVISCASCAREWPAAKSLKMAVAEIPQKQLLKPTHAHPNHTMYHGMLLYSPAVDEQSQTTLCSDCLSSLEKGRKPQFSLANNMWIGDVPRALSLLTLPERMLVAKYFPAAHIIKLFPKQRGAVNWDRRQMQNGLKGNVSTYRLDPSQVAGMVEGNLMPQPSKILSATIGVTFIRPKGLRERTMPDMFRVRRSRVQAALQWLKTNNPLYADITISKDRLNELPANAVPEELLRTAKYSNETDLVDAEQDGYVPEDALDEAVFHDGGLVDVDEVEAEQNGEHEEDDCTEPAIIPLSSNGVVDVEGVDISRRELMAHALLNSVQPQDPEDFSIRRGSAFVNEYARKNETTGLRTDGGPSNPNHLLGSFPTLFPYGQGAFEIEREIEVPYETHVRWALQYADKRFRKDPQFPFQVFGVCQKRQVCRAAVLQMKKRNFVQHQNLLANLTPQDLQKASEEETRNVPFSNPAVRALRNDLRGMRTKVVGSNKSRFTIRSKIWGTNLIYNPPSLWITINPADTHDPIAQVIAGEDICLDSFCNTAGPDHLQRAINIANDPYAAARFFHFMIATLFETVFGIRATKGRIERKQGAFGIVQSYIGTVEAQGRGTLHLHLLVWLKDAPSMRKMKEGLVNPDFRNKIKAYISKTIRADIDTKSNEEISQIPKEPGVSYSRPFNPFLHPKEASEQEKSLARTTQYHKCSQATCLIVVKGRLRCKRRAPFPLAHEDWANEVGDWGPKRFCQYLNSWAPTIMRTLRANNDIKLIMNGAETSCLTWYLTNYATKKQQRSFNTSALLAKKLAFHQSDRRREDLETLNRRLIERCANALTTDREFSAPEIISYLMGWNDRYESHFYATIYWDAAVNTLRKAYPALHGTRSVNEKRCNQINVLLDSLIMKMRETNRWRHVHSLVRSESEHSSCEQEAAGVIALTDGKVIMKDQLKDYQYRGDELAHSNFLDFVLNTYDGKIRDNKTAETEDHQPPSNRGRPPNIRVAYKSGADKPSRCRIIRSAGHETLPRFVGRWFPRNDTDVDQEFYCASMLLLLKPWVELDDLKESTETFENSFKRMVQHANKKIHTVLENIQYFHDCSDSAALRKKEEGTQLQEPVDFELEYQRDQYDEEENDDGIIVHEEFSSRNITEEDIECARHSQQPMREQLFATDALNAAGRAGIFPSEGHQTVYLEPAPRASSTDLPTYKAWEKQLRDTTRKMMDTHGIINFGGAQPEVIVGLPEVVETEPAVHEATSASTSSTANATTRNRPKLQTLNAEQRRAHDMVEEKLKAHLAEEKTTPLRLLILGPGGTGKSTLISAITETFQFYSAEHLLAKCATTGIAASDIQGKTVHAWASLSVNTSTNENWLDKAGENTKEKRRRNIEGAKFLVLDEVSMAHKVLVYLLSEVVVHAKAAAGEEPTGDPFSGLHVILSGDFHQFPPINSTGALYCSQSEKDKRALLGREIFLGFDKVVMLTEQIRVTDEKWSEILQRLRTGDCSDDDLEEIEKLIVTDPRCPPTNYSEDPWKNAILITPRNAVREAWNNAALRRHCAATGNPRYIVPAEDTISNSGEAPPTSARLTVAGLGPKKTGKLSDRIEIAKGMKTMVITNLATEADISNGTRGTIEDIRLDPREGQLEEDENGAIKLHYPPALILFRPDGGTDLKFPGLEPQGLVPITPSKALFTVTTPLDNRKHKIRRRQYAMTAGYAFTDYKSQGQTIEFVIIDLADPPSGCLSPFNAYVALSRSRGRNNIRLLRAFNMDLFTHHPSEDLRREMERLTRLDALTKDLVAAEKAVGDSD